MEALAVHLQEMKTFTKGEIKLFWTFASQAVIAREKVLQFKVLATCNTELGDRVEKQVGEFERIGKLKRILPAAVADAIFISGSETILESHRALLVVLFCDIRGFKAFCDTAESEETPDVLQTYHEDLGKLIGGHGWI